MAYGRKYYKKGYGRRKSSARYGKRKVYKVVYFR